MRFGLNPRGYTLVELMVALTLGAVLFAGSIEIYERSRAVYNEQKATSVVVENGRVMSQVLRNVFANSGYWGCLADKREALHLDVTNPAADAFPYFTGRASTQATDLGISRTVLSDIITVFTAESETQAFTCTHDPADPAVCPEELILESGATSVSHILSFDTGGHDLSAGDLITLSDCRQATALVVNSVVDATQLQYGGTNCGADDPRCTFGDRVSVMRIQKRHFYYAANDRGSNSFYLQLENGSEVELIDGVTSFSVRYGVDDQRYNGSAFQSGPDGSVDQYVSLADNPNWESVMSARFEYTISSLGFNPVEQSFETVATLRNYRKD